MNDGISQQILSKSKSVLSDGGIIIFPTETVYGLGADIFNEESINRIYKIKGRDFNKYNTDLIKYLFERYQPDNYTPSTQDEKSQLNYCIAHEISKKLSKLLTTF